MDRLTGAGRAFYHTAVSLLGIDIGTTGCKAAAYSVEGRCVGSAYREYPTLHEAPGRAELDSEAVWRSVQACIAEAASAASHDPVRALSVSSLGEAMTPVSRDRRILGRSILCSDTRGADYVDVFRSELGEEGFYRINPNILTPAYSMPKLAWLRDHEPELYRRADRFLLWSDLVGYLLGGEPITSCSHANRTLLFDIHRERWSEELLELSGIDPIKLPQVAPSGSIAGTVSPRIAAELGLPSDVTIVVGGHDQCCTALGAGVVRPGLAVCGTGTFECYAPAFAMPENPLEMYRLGLNIEHHVVPGLFLTFVYNQGGALVRWFRDTFAAGDGGADVYDRLTAEMPDDPTRLLALPYFEPTGPPAYVADAAGAIVGLTTDTTRGEILKAIMECVTLYFVESLATLRGLGLASGEFVAVGGGARSDAWLQIKADAFGVPFVRPRVTEAGALGAAILAGVATGIVDSFDGAVQQMTARERTFEPDPARHARYREKREVYARLYPALAGILANPHR